MNFAALMFLSEIDNIALTGKRRVSLHLHNFLPRGGGSDTTRAPPGRHPLLPRVRPLNPVRPSSAPVCLQGFWSQELQDSAQDVVEMKFAYKKTKANRRIQTIFVLVTMAIFGTLWLFVHYAS